MTRRVCIGLATLFLCVAVDVAGIVVIARHVVPGG